MTREIAIPAETWTLVTINSCSFQADANLQVAELDVSPSNWSDPKKVIIKSKIYEYQNTPGKGLWAISGDDALITIDDSSTISETSGGYLRTCINPVGGLDVNVGTIDAVTGSITTVDYPHHEIHAGSHYNYLDTHNLAKNGVIDHMIVTPDTDVYAHFVIGVSSITSTVLLAVYEDTIYSDPGAVEPMINRNRNFPDDNTTELYENPVITDVGTRLLRITIGAGKNSDGGSARDDNEIVLKRNTAYLVRATELNIAATTINLVFDWYEHQSVV